MSLVSKPNDICLYPREEFGKGQSLAARKKISGSCRETFTEIEQAWCVWAWTEDAVCVTYMTICQVEQVPQPTATAVPALIADAVLQHDVVRSNRTEHFMNLLSRLTCIDLIYLQAKKQAKMGKGLEVKDSLQIYGTCSKNVLQCDLNFFFKVSKWRITGHWTSGLGDLC